MTKQLSVNIARAEASCYPILIGADLYDVNSWLPTKRFSRIVIITDNLVKKRYGLNLLRKLKKSGHNSLLLSFPAGEKSKNYKTKLSLEDKMHLNRCDRDTLIIALGGGVVGDLAGFIAANYLRGVAYIQIPTTLLAMVDSSVGGKTGINTKHGKNLIGAIYQPVSVVADVMLLKTLSKKNMINGLIEAIKMFLTHDAASLCHTEAHLSLVLNGNDSILKEVVSQAVSIKAAVVARDEKERGERSILNFGHTIGHALEKVTGYRLLHGYAVAYGILVEATISQHLGLLDGEQLSLIKELFAKLDIHGKDLRKYELTKLIQATKTDKKSRLGKVHYTLLREIGSAYVTEGNYVHPVTDKIVRQAFKSTIEG